jgi:ribonuclease HIII
MVVVEVSISASDMQVIGYGTDLSGSGDFFGATVPSRVAEKSDTN